MTMSYRICPRCNKSREVLEKVEEKDGKAWRIEYCQKCSWNWEIFEVVAGNRSKRRQKFKWGFGQDDDPDYTELDDN